jgi:hypothetical protein
VITRAALCVAGAAIALGFVMTKGFSAEDEMRQYRCGLDNGFVSFYLRKESEMGTVGARSYIVDFQDNGPTIRLPPEYYAPGWDQIEEIAFESIGPSKVEGRLSLKVRGGFGHVYVQPIGIIQRACWNAAKDYLQRNKIKRPIKETNK